MRGVISRRLEITPSMFFSVKFCRKIPQTSEAYSRNSMPPRKKKQEEEITAEDLSFEDVEDNFTEIALYMDTMRQRADGVASRFLPLELLISASIDLPIELLANAVLAALAKELKVRGVTETNVSAMYTTIKTSTMMANVNFLVREMLVPVPKSKFDDVVASHGTLTHTHNTHPWHTDGTPTHTHNTHPQPIHTRHPQDHNMESKVAASAS